MRSCDPRASDLRQLMDQHFEMFQQVSEQRCQPKRLEYHELGGDYCDTLGPNRHHITWSIVWRFL